MEDRTFRQLGDCVGDEGLATVAKDELLQAGVCHVVVELITRISICSTMGNQESKAHYAECSPQMAFHVVS